MLKTKYGESPPSFPTLIVCRSSTVKARFCHSQVPQDSSWTSRSKWQSLLRPLCAVLLRAVLGGAEPPGARLPLPGKAAGLPGLRAPPPGQGPRPGRAGGRRAAPPPALPPRRRPAGGAAAAGSAPPGCPRPAAEGAAGRERGSAPAGRHRHRHTPARARRRGRSGTGSGCGAERRPEGRWVAGAVGLRGEWGAAGARCAAPGAERDLPAGAGCGSRPAASSRRGGAGGPAGASRARRPPVRGAALGRLNFPRVLRGGRRRPGPSPASFKSGRPLSPPCCLTTPPPAQDGGDFALPPLSPAPVRVVFPPWSRCSSRRAGSQLSVPRHTPALRDVCFADLPSDTRRWTLPPCTQPSSWPFSWYLCLGFIMK